MRCVGLRMLVLVLDFCWRETLQYWVQPLVCLWFSFYAPRLLDTSVQAMASHASANGSTRPTTCAKEPAAKRQKLRRDDHVSVILCHPFGISDGQGATLADLWDYASKGNKRVASFMEFASTDPMVRGIAITRTAEVLNLAIKELSRDHWKSLLNAKIYEALDKDMKAIST